MLDDKYRIERLLATGGMGAVYLGTHIGLRKRVAIKVLNPHMSSAPMIERFHREAITASQIGHEGIAQVTDLGTSGDGEPFLVMEYLEGESLASRLKASGRLGIEDACELGCAILSPLTAAHHAGIIHRDLKPDNVFLVRQSRGEMVKLLDFGISRAAGRESNFRLTTTGLVLGTPYYMSPEQARGDSEVTVAADLYAFGVMLYEMLVGDVPIRADNYNQLMYRVMMGDFVWPRKRRPELPEELERIIVQAMAQDPGDRPAGASELESALLPFCRPVFREHASGQLSVSGLSLVAQLLPSARLSDSAPGASGGSVNFAMAGGGTVARHLHEPGAREDLEAATTERNLRPPAATPEPPESSRPGPPGPPGTPGTPGPIAHDTLASAAMDAAPRRTRFTQLLIALGIVAAGVVLVGSLAFTITGRAGKRAAATPPAPRSVAPVTLVAPATPATTPVAPPAATPVPTPPPSAAAPAHDGENTAPAPPVEPATITLRLAIEPSSATVTLDGARVVGSEIAVPRDSAMHHLKITAPGYLGRDETIAFDESQRLVVQLRRAAAPTRGKLRKDRDDERIDSQSPYR